VYRAYPSGSKKRKKAKEEKLTEELQVSQEAFKLLFYSSSEVQRRHFCGTCTRAQNRITVVADLDHT